MINLPKVSIIVACYNVEHYIEQCINSLINQTYKNIEIIAINDESTDKTHDKLLQLKSIDGRINVVNQKNVGLSQVRNNGIVIATGAFIVFVDGDDWLDFNCVYKLIEESKNNDLVCCSYFKVFQSRNDVRKLNLHGTYDASLIQKRIVGLTGKELSDPSQADSLVTAWGKLYDANIIKENKIKFTDTKLIGTEDALFNISYLQYGKSVYIIDAPLYYYRKYNINSLTANYKSNLSLQWGELYSRIYAIIENKDETFYQAYQNRICLGIIGIGLNELLSKNSFFDKCAKIREILKNERYSSAFKNFKLSYLPIHWKIFFFFAKYSFVFPLMLMMWVIKKIISR
jgi:glycosyltransferase EpsH